MTRQKPTLAGVALPAIGASARARQVGPLPDI